MRKTALSLVGQRAIVINGNSVTYTVKRSPRARLVRLQIRPETGLTVVIPRHFDIERLPELLLSKGRWILNKSAEYLQDKARPTNYPADGDTVPYLGERLTIARCDSSDGVEMAKREANRLVVNITLPGTSTLGSLLKRWYLTQAAELMTAKAETLSMQIGVRFGKLIIRGQKTRWGSCSAKGTISFNWKLAAAPEPVIDYVVIHELAHLKEMNHSGKFWGIVARYCPQWRQHKRWLRDNEADLNARLSF